MTKPPNQSSTPPKAPPGPPPEEKPDLSGRVLKDPLFDREVNNFDPAMGDGSGWS